MGGDDGGRGDDGKVNININSSNNNSNNDNKLKLSFFALSQSKKKQSAAVAAQAAAAGFGDRDDLRRDGDRTQQQQQQLLHVWNGSGREESNNNQLVIPVAPDNLKWKNPTSFKKDDNDKGDEFLEQTQQQQEEEEATNRATAAQATTSETSTKSTTSATSTIQPIDDDDSNNNNHHDKESLLFQKDLHDLPDELTLDDYQKPNAIPISQFGAALLRGMGWKGTDDASSSGNNNKTKKMEEEESLPRPHRLGLGAMPSMNMMKKNTNNSNNRKILRPDQVRQQERLQKQLEEFANNQQRQKQQLRAQDKQVTLQNGSIVWLLHPTTTTNGGETAESGVHPRPRARVVQLMGVPGLNKVRVQVERSKDVLIVSRSDLGSLVPRSELEAEPFVETMIADPDKNDTTSKATNPKNRRHPDDDVPDDDHRNRVRKQSNSDNEEDKDAHKKERKKESNRDDAHRKNRQHKERRREGKRRRHSDSSSDDDESESDSDSDDSRRGRRRHHRDKKKHKRSSRDKEEDKDTKKKNKKHSRSDKNKEQKDDHDDGGGGDAASWLMPHIRVRVVSTKFGKQHFQQKGVVVDVTPRGATLRMDRSSSNRSGANPQQDVILDHVSARYLTTALPKVNGCAVVVVEQKQKNQGTKDNGHNNNNNYKGARGTVLQRDANRAVLQLHEDHTILTLPLDDLAEWCGPRDDDDYY